ncbi:MAG: molybdate ABC transporter permease subunit [Anaerolineaceae bacterium]|nr:molybdate ABC transporter permease subunit [Anaerolineaceae bacterium]
MTSLTVEKKKINTALPSREISLKFNNFWWLATFPMLLFITFPIVALFLQVTPTDLWVSLQDPVVGLAISTSLRTSLTTTLLTFLFGLPVALLLAQKNFRFSRLVDTLIDLPTVLPPAVAGIALLMAFGRVGLLGSGLSDLGISLPFTSVAVVMAQLFVAAPLFIKAAAIGFSSVTPELKQAAALDGATRWQTFRFIILPGTWTALLSGLVMTWARALGEFGATIIFAGNFAGRTQTMPLAIYLGFEINLKLALTLAVILISFSFLVLVLVKQVLYPRFTD